jgi:hypothetical protein
MRVLRKPKDGIRGRGMPFGKMVIAERKPELVQEYQKSQNIRLIDVFVIAPILIYAGMQKSQPEWLRYSLIGIGIATLYYNGKNYLVNRKSE